MQLGYFGKLPSRADFVRFNATAPVYRAFDDWIQGGLRTAASPQYAEFNQAYASAGTSCFVFRPAGGHGALVGAIRPSRDQAGRNYPFFVATPVDEVARLEEYGLFFDRAAELVSSAVESRLNTEQLNEQLQNSPIHMGPGGAGSDLSQVSFGTLCEQLWGSFFDSRKYATFKNLLDLLLPMRGKGQPVFSYGLKFPIADGDLQKTSIRFWLDTCSALLDLPGFKSSMVWNLGDGHGSSDSYLYVYFSRVPATGLFGIAQLDIDVNDLYAIDSLQNRNPAELALSIPEQFGRLIEAENLSLAEVTQGFRAPT